MKTRITRTALTKALRTITPAVHKGGGLPVMSGVRIEVGDGLRLSATNGELSIDTSSEAETIDPGVAIPPAGLLARLAGALGAERVELEADSERLTVTCGDTTATLPLYPIEEWPRLLTTEGQPVTLGRTDCERILRILPLASVDDHKQHLQCVHFAPRRATTTDSYRAAVLTLDAETPDVLVPATVVAMVLRDADTIEMVADDRTVSFTDRTTTWRLPIVTASYPDIENSRLIREDSPHSLTFESAALLEVIDRCVKFGDAPTIIALDPDSDTVLCSLARVDGGTLAETIAAEVNFDQRIGFNAEHLASVFEAVGDERMRMELLDPEKPCIVRNDSMVALVMPSRLVNV